MTLAKVVGEFVSKLEDKHFVKERVNEHMVNLRDVLTNEEQECISELKNFLKDADTKKDINYYSKEIHSILDKAKERYNITKDIMFQDILTLEEQEEVAKLKQCIIDAQTRKSINCYMEKIDEVLGHAEVRYFLQTIS